MGDRLAVPYRVAECIPNCSEGRDPAKVEAIRRAIASTPGVLLLKAERDPDHNRAVITFAGEPEAVLEGAFQGIRRSVELVDLTAHSGVHPRIGVADVVPFVPIENLTLADCVDLAHRLGGRVWSELELPVYFYEAAALRPECIPLEAVRRVGLRESMPPDLGGPKPHPTAGACVIGARKFLIAFNVNLECDDLNVARAIARKIRASSGGLPFVKAIGVRLESRGIVQVSINLTDFEQTPLHIVLERVKAEAAKAGVSIRSTEIIGLIPKKAIEMAAGFYLQVEDYSANQILENRLLEMSMPL